MSKARVWFCCALMGCSGGGEDAAVDAPTVPVAPTAAPAPDTPDEAPIDDDPGAAVDAGEEAMELAEEPADDAPGAPAAPATAPVKGAEPAAASNPAGTPGSGSAAKTEDPPPATADAGEVPAVAAADDAAPAAAETVTYALDASKSSLYVQVYKDPDTMAAGMSHDHVITASRWTGTVTWNPDDPGQCDVRIELPVTGLSPDAASMRKAVGYDGELSSGQREDVKENMLAKGQLNASKFSTIQFASTGCSGSGNKVTVKGDLTIRGTSAPVSTTLTVSADARSFSGSGTFYARHTDFGFDPYTAMMGALKNQNKMKFTVKLKGTAQ